MSFHSRFEKSREINCHSLSVHLRSFKFPVRGVKEREKGRHARKYKFGEVVLIMSDKHASCIHRMKVHGVKWGNVDDDETSVILLNF